MVTVSFFGSRYAACSTTGNAIMLEMPVLWQYSNAEKAATP
jgi:hypothetical protein